MSAGSHDRVSRRLAPGLLALLMLACAAALLPAHASARGTCPNENSTFTTETPALRASVLCLVNVTRLGRGLPALQRDSRLENAAQLHTDDMVARGYFAHDSPPPNSTTFSQRIQAAGYPIGTAAESIAVGSSTPKLVVDLWLVDRDVVPPGHCQNILSPGMRDLGVGIGSGVIAPFSGGVWTKDFGRLTTQAAPSSNMVPFNACPDALSPIVAGPTPTAATAAATTITASSATVNGTANANGGGFTSYHVEYGTTTAYGGQTLERVDGTAGVTVTEPLSGLAADTYHFQVVAMNHNGETRSLDRVFTTTGSPARPLVSTGAATAVTQTTATLNGSVNPAGLATTYHFEYGLTTAYESSTTSPTAGSDTVAQAAGMAITGLTPGTLYHARMVATNSADTTFGTDIIFTTLAPPIVVTGSATAGVTTATLNGFVNPKGKATTYHFDYGTTTAYGSSTANLSAGSGSATVASSSALSGLTPGTTYLFRVVAT
ncbi:MAG: CAP domain-containing protein, partial [Ilumatobacteraceae bacterium]